MLENYPDLLIAEDCCEILHMSRNTLYSLLHSGELKGFQQNHIWKVPKQAVIEYITKQSGMGT